MKYHSLTEEQIMRKRRNFSAAFKTQVVLQLLSGEKSQAELCREHQINGQLLNTWKSHFLAHASSVFESHNPAPEQERVAELERMVGKLTMQLDIAKKASTLLGGMSPRNG
jgi:transposase